MKDLFNVDEMMKSIKEDVAIEIFNKMNRKMKSGDSLKIEDAAAIPNLYSIFKEKGYGVSRKGKDLVIIKK